MNDMTKQLLQQSIANWELRLKAKTHAEYTDAYQSCVLCDKFADCNKCPVHAKTNARSCYNTPYYDAQTARQEWFYVTHNEFTQTAINKARTQYRKACRAEIKFLKSLLPKDES